MRLPEDYEGYDAKSEVRNPKSEGFGASRVCSQGSEFVPYYLAQSATPSFRISDFELRISFSLTRAESL